MRQTPRTIALERRYPFRCKVIYFPQQETKQDIRAPQEQMNWYMRSPMLPRVGDVVPFGQTLFSVTAVILEDCYSTESAAKLDRLAGRIAEKDETPRWHAVLWVAFWGVRAV